MAVLEGNWDCAQCLTKGIPGSKQDCPMCGSPHDTTLDSSEEYYLKEDARVVTDPEELKIANGGPDWSCGHCGESNRDSEKICRECKQPRDTDDVVNPVTVYVDGVAAEGEVLSSTEDLEKDRTDATLEWADKLQPLEDGPVTLPTRTLSKSALPRQGMSPYDREHRPQDVVRSERPQDMIRSSAGRTLTVAREAILGSPNVVMAVAGIMSVVLVVLLGGNWFYDNYVKTNTVDLTVSSLAWERSIEIEVYRTLTQEDWSVPADGRVIGSRTEIRSYRQVVDHYETRTRQVGERKRTGSHSERYICGSRTVNKGNGYYETQNTYCTRSVDDYTTVYHSESYQVPVYRNEPVYDTKYTYQVDRWMTDHYERASGSKNPYWPSTRISGPKERLGSRSQTYSVVLLDAKNRRSSHTMEETVWSRLSEGQVIRGEQTHSGSVRRVYWP